MRNTMRQMIEVVADEAKLTKAKTKEVLEAAANYIEVSVKAGDEVAFAKLGTFKPADRAARASRNLFTGASIQIPAKRTLVFKPSAKLKDLDAA